MNKRKAHIDREEGREGGLKEILSLFSIGKDSVALINTLQYNAFSHDVACLLVYVN